jgi:hypothetical protein
MDVAAAVTQRVRPRSAQCFASAKPSRAKDCTADQEVHRRTKALQAAFPAMPNSGGTRPK